MLVFELRAIGDKLLSVRKKMGMTQAEVAEAAELSDRAYAEIERGLVNMRVETLLKICRALRITPDDVLTAPEEEGPGQEEVMERLNACAPKDRDTALRLLAVFLQSLN